MIYECFQRSILLLRASISLICSTSIFRLLLKLKISEGVCVEILGRSEAIPIRASWEKDGAGGRVEGKLCVLGDNNYFEILNIWTKQPGTENELEVRC